jgi:DNA-binding transcriptional MerR regulator
MLESGNGHSSSLLPEKSFFRIGEVSRLTATKPFVLRYWETEFPMLQPVKSPKGHRLYRREDVKTVLEIRRLLYDEGFTIAGARRHLREHDGFTGVPGDSNGENGEASSERGTQQLSGAVSPTSGASSGNASPMTSGAAALAQGEPMPAISRKVLLDLRDAIRAFLTLLDSE